MRRKRERLKTKNTGVTFKCVSVENYKPRSLNELPISKGDIIEILLREPERWKGKCGGRTGWIQPEKVLPVMSIEDLEKFDLNMKGGRKRFEGWPTNQPVEEENDSD